jgi:hypothetical protein
MGERWDNRRWVGPWLDEAAALLRDHAAHIELTLHGIGHEFWSGPSFTRAEWHDREGRMRPEADVRAHLDYFSRLQEQNGLGPFPVSFVPAAFLHRFGSGLAGVLADYGVRYISTPYHTLFRARATEDVCFGIDEGVLTVDRGRDLIHWKVIGAEPAGVLSGPVCGMHWPNLLHADPARNTEVVERWVCLLRPYDTLFEYVLSPDTAAAFSQLVYHRWTGIATDAGGVTLDFSKVDAAATASVIDTLILKVQADASHGFRGEGVDILEARREGGQWRLCLRRTPGGGQARLKLVQGKG